MSCRRPGAFDEGLGYGVAMTAEREDITELLDLAAAGDLAASEELFEAVYQHLRGIAHNVRARQVGSPSLATTEIVHEAYLRMARSDGDFENRGHFYAVACLVMKRLLIDQARRRLSAKRRGDEEAVPLDEAKAAEERREAELFLTLHDSLEKLGEVDERLRKVVEFRFFGGLSEAQAAEALGVGARTVRRDWVRARAWLRAHLEG